MADGYLGLIAEAGIRAEVRISSKAKEERSRRDDFSPLEVGFYKDGEEVLVMDQYFRKNGIKAPMEELYRRAAITLGLYKPSFDPEPMPVDLTIAYGELGGEKETVYNHPSFGVATLSKVAGGSKPFMSPVNTRGYMQFDIQTAELHQRAGTDHVFGRKLLMRINLSFTQFAELITSQGNGSGIPITIDYYNGVGIPPVELPTYMERLAIERKEKMDAAHAELHRMLRELDLEMSGAGPLAAGKKRETWEKIKMMVRELDSTPKFIIDQMKEHLDIALAHGKSEFANWAKEKITHLSQQRLNDIKTHGELGLPGDRQENADV